MSDNFDPDASNRIPIPTGRMGGGNTWRIQNIIRDYSGHVKIHLEIQDAVIVGEGGTMLGYTGTTKILELSPADLALFKNMLDTLDR